MSLLPNEKFKDVGILIFRLVLCWYFLSLLYLAMQSFIWVAVPGIVFESIGLVLLSIGGILLLLGLGTRIVSIVAFIYFQAPQLAGLGVSLWSFPMTLIFLLLFFIGAGTYSLDYVIAQRKKKILVPTPAA
jgi:hypothetical protein